MLFASFSDVFNFHDDKSKGRVIALSSSLLTTFYNVFITGIFYTGFLSMYGMSITDTGILTFIPFLATLLSVFSPKILAHFPRRKEILLVSKIIFYVFYIILTTVMPQFVEAPDARLKWFIVILAVGYGFYALFSGGFTTWFYNFYPDDNEKRTRYLSFSQIFASIMSSVVLLVSSLITDALSNSPFQDQLILGFRYFAFILVFFDVYIQSKAVEYPYQESTNIKLIEIFTIPFRHKKFLACMVMMFIWNYIANLNNGLWSFHLLNHMNFSYTLINIMSVLYTVILVLLSPMWRKVLQRYSWIKTFGIAVLLWVPTEFLFFFMTPDRGFMYVPLCIIQHVMGVGLNLAYANILYMNLPSENSTACITFNTIGCNIGAFLGLMTGTFISSVTGDNTVYMLGMDVYSVQFTVIARGVLMLVLGICLVWKWRSFTGDQEIADIELQERMRQRYGYRPQGLSQWLHHFREVIKYRIGK